MASESALQREDIADQILRGNIKSISLDLSQKLGSLFSDIDNLKKGDLSSESFIAGDEVELKRTTKVHKKLPDEISLKTFRSFLENNNITEVTLQNFIIKLILQNTPESTTGLGLPYKIASVLNEILFSAIVFNKAGYGTTKELLAIGNPFQMNLTFKKESSSNKYSAVIEIDIPIRIASTESSSDRIVGSTKTKVIISSDKQVYISPMELSVSNKYYLIKIFEAALNFFKNALQSIKKQDTNEVLVAEAKQSSGSFRK